METNAKVRCALSNTKFLTDISACEYSNPCVNGTCINKGTGIQVYPYCQCQAGYTGLACDEGWYSSIIYVWHVTEINFCTTYTPCDYNSTCIPSFNNYSCDCIPGTTDYNCSTSTTKLFVLIQIV